MTNEVKLFSETLETSKLIRPALIASSRSMEDAMKREKVYQKVFSNYMDLKEAAKLFSGYTESNLLGNQYFNATVTSFVTSFAGFLTIERSMDQATALLYFLDVIGALDGRKVMPNIGAEDFSTIAAKIDWSTALAVGTADYSVALGKKVIPGSIRLSLVKSGAAPVLITDDRAGKLIAAPGVLSAGTINYSSGNLAFSIGAGYTIAAGDSAVLVAFEDAAGTPELGGTSTFKNRFKTDMKHIEVATAPDMLIGETNLIALAAMQKSLGVNAQDILAAKLIEMFTKVINKAIVSEINDKYVGDAMEIDLTSATTNFQDFRSQLDLFSAKLIDVDGELANKSAKGVKATSYLAGRKAADWFRKTKQIGLFRDNVDSTYINDLIGFYDNVPVLRSTDVADSAAYAVCKTADGNLAPVMRGIFLPLTNTPSVGNYNNPTQVSQGVFYQEGHKNIANELLMKFTIKEA